MSVLASVEDLRDFMNGVSLATPQVRAAQMVLDGLEGQLRTYLRTPLVPEDRTERAWIDGQGYATLKASPINSVTSVALDSETATQVHPLDGQFKVSGNSIYVGWSVGHDHVVVTYNGGPDHRGNADMKLAILTVAARAMAPRHDEGRTLNGLQADQRAENANPRALPPRFTQEELEQFVNYRRPYGF